MCWTTRVIVFYRFDLSLNWSSSSLIFYDPPPPFPPPLWENWKVTKEQLVQRRNEGDTKKKETVYYKGSTLRVLFIGESYHDTQQQQQQQLNICIWGPGRKRTPSTVACLPLVRAHHHTKRHRLSLFFRFFSEFKTSSQEQHHRHQ